ncbi:MAG: hypothetical protein IMX01_10530 [Limnochordaceae bacterium]|nr:hypothetical protein [Limnochordaceae bacterium]
MKHVASKLEGIGPEYTRLQAHLQAWRQVLKAAPPSGYEQLIRALGPIREQHLKISRLFYTVPVTPCAFALSELARANQHWQDVIDKALGQSRALEDLRRVHRTWLETTKGMPDSAAWLQGAAATSLSDTIYRLTLSEKLLTRVDFEALKTLALPSRSLSAVVDSVGSAASAYARLAESVRALKDVTHLPEFLLPGATREVFTTGYALNGISVVEAPEDESDSDLAELVAHVTRETSGWESLLRSVDPDLAAPYIGAHEALGTANPDKARHVLISLRELWQHLLRRLAPDHEVLAWMPADSNDLVHNGRPTWKARVRYICRAIAHGPLGDFAVEDTNSLVKLLNLFNRVHELREGLTERQLHALVLRSDSWLMYILRVYEAAKQS